MDKIVYYSLSTMDKHLDGNFGSVDAARCAAQSYAAKSGKTVTVWAVTDAGMWRNLGIVVA